MGFLLHRGFSKPSLTFLVANLVKTNLLKRMGVCVQMQLKTGSIFAMAILAATACVPASAGSVELSCSVDGAHHIGSPAEICAAFQNEIHAALNRPVKTVEVFPASGIGDAVDVDVRVLKRGGVVAQVKQRKKGTTENFPEIAVDVMDRPLAMRDVEMLAREVAKLFATSAK
jgi:TRAP-type C4-dicarboxylate transport system substrate-binding protein